MNLMRRFAVATVAATCLLGLAGSPGMAAPGPSATVPTIVVERSQVTQNYTATPSSLELNVGDTFQVENRLMGSGDEMYVAVQDRTGSVRMGSTVCDTPTSCTIADDFPNNPVKSFVAVRAGTVRIVRFDGLAQLPVTPVGLVKINDPSPQRSIIISGDRASTHGKPRIVITGNSVGLGSGVKLRVFVKLRARTSFTEASSQPVIGANGAFAWQRKTARKAYVYVTSLDGKTKSNTIFIGVN